MNSLKFQITTCRAGKVERPFFKLILLVPKLETGNKIVRKQYGPRSFAKMTIAERVRACYQHTVVRYLSGERMKNSSLCKRFGFESKNAAQASKVINISLEKQVIRAADPEHPRAGYVPWWA